MAGAGKQSRFLGKTTTRPRPYPLSLQIVDAPPGMGATPPGEQSVYDYLFGFKTGLTITNFVEEEDLRYYALKLHQMLAKEKMQRTSSAMTLYSGHIIESSNGPYFRNGRHDWRKEREDHARAMHQQQMELGRLVRIPKPEITATLAPYKQDPVPTFPPCTTRFPLEKLTLVENVFRPRLVAIEPAKAEGRPKYPDCRFANAPDAPSPVVATPSPFGMNTVVQHQFQQQHQEATPSGSTATTTSYSQVKETMRSYSAPKKSKAEGLPKYPACRYADAPIAPSPVVATPSPFVMNTVVQHQLQQQHHQEQATAPGSMATTSSYSQVMETMTFYATPEPPVQLKIKNEPPPRPSCPARVAASSAPPSENEEDDDDEEQTGGFQLCPFCKSYFLRDSALSKHLRDYHDNGQKAIEGRKVMYKCEHCGKDYDDNKAYIVHSGLRKKLKCHMCTDQFWCESSMKSHYITGHLQSVPTKGPSCDICHHTISSRHGLAVHYLTHMGSKWYRCQSCPKEFKTAGALSKHLTTCHQL